MLMISLISGDVAQYAAWRYQPSGRYGFYGVNWCKCEWYAGRAEPAEGGLR
ncbi:hypothetical protein ETAR_18060 [Edwardsiella tarda]